MVPFGDLSGHINDLTSKKIPLAACASRKKLATSSLGWLCVAVRSGDGPAHPIKFHLKTEG